MIRNPRLWIAGTVLAVCIFGIPQTGFSKAADVVNDGGAPQFLFVQSADSGSLQNGKLMLNGAGSTIYFSDRPNRIGGHIPTKKFVENWNKGSDTFKADPPNGVLSIFTAEGVQNAAVELTQPEWQGNTLSYSVRVLGGQIPPTFQEASLFIDSSNAGWGVAGGLLGGMLLDRVMNPPAQQQQPPAYYYAPPPPYYAQEPQY